MKTRIQQHNLLPIRSPWLIASRLLIAAVFLAGAFFNAFVTLRAPAIELGRLIDLSPLAFIRDLARGIAIPYATPFVIAVILFEISMAVSVLLRIKVRRRAYMVSLAFFLVLMPLIGWYAVSNLVWALPALGLLCYDRPDTTTASHAP
ncbi:MAG TPA: hypothetical protein PKI62_14040 [bacterium]|nr:hypothetical protein [bacterium]HPR87723.1 hypothetical protein [bacterium]